VTLFRGVYPVAFDVTQYKIWEVTRHALDTLIEKGLIAKGDKVILTKGDILGVGGHTNALKILTA
jgi:pyruvate kinase